MLESICLIIRAHLSELPFIERHAGLVDVLRRAKIVGEGPDRKPVGWEVYPVAYGTSFDRCWEDGTYKALVPDTSLGGLAFFHDVGNGVQMTGVTGPKEGVLQFSFRVRLLVWLNLARLGIESGNVTPKIAPLICAKLYGRQLVDFNGGPEEQMFKTVKVTNVTQVARSPRMFEPFTFAEENRYSALFLWPYDYAGFDISGSFDVPRTCLPEIFGEDFAFLDSWCFPFAGPTGGPSNPGSPAINPVKKYLNSLEFYPNDELARQEGLETDDHYWFSVNTDRGIAYTIKRVEPL